MALVQHWWCLAVFTLCNAVTLPALSSCMLRMRYCIPCMQSASRETSSLLGMRHTLPWAAPPLGSVELHRVRSRWCYYCVLPDTRKQRLFHTTHTRVT